MNAYDFDKTIFDGDSTAAFYFYCLRHQPRIMKWLPYQGWSFLLYSLKIIDKTTFKERFYKFFTSIRNMDATLEKFWDKNICRIKKWYLEQSEEDDLIISASPEFLLRPACERLQIKGLIASRVNPESGEYTGLNCWGEEKVRRLLEEKGDIAYDYFYSDSYSDTPLADRAKVQSFLVKGEKLLKW